MKTTQEQTSALEELFGGGPELPKTYWMGRWAKESELKAELLAALKMAESMIHIPIRGAFKGYQQEKLGAIRAAIAKAERGAL